LDEDNDTTPDDCDALIDNDGDGVANDEDLCEGHDDALDADEDETPDGCDDLIDVGEDHLDSVDDDGNLTQTNETQDGTQSDRVSEANDAQMKSEQTTMLGVLGLLLIGVIAITQRLRNKQE
jgi:hypothetical protein